MPKGTLLFFVVHISHCDEIFISQYIGTPVTDVITSSHLDKNVQFWLFEGPWGPFNDQTGLILFASYPSTHIYVHVKTEAIWQKLCTFKSKIWTKYHSFHIWGSWGGGGGFTSNPRYQFCMEVWLYDSADMCNDLGEVKVRVTQGMNRHNQLMI